MRWSSKVRRLYRQKGEDQSSTTVVGESTTDVGSWDAAVRVQSTLSPQLVTELNVELPTHQSRHISKAAPTPKILNSLERQSTEPRIHTIPIATSEERWHKKVQESRDSLEYPITGRGCAEPRVAVHCLKQTTELYLKETFKMEIYRSEMGFWVPSSKNMGGSIPIHFYWRLSPALTPYLWRQHSRASGS